MKYVIRWWFTIIVVFVLFFLLVYINIPKEIKSLDEVSAECFIFHKADSAITKGRDTIVGLITEMETWDKNAPTYDQVVLSYNDNINTIRNNLDDIIIIRDKYKCTYNELKFLDSVLVEKE